jgi:hypothetical protein
VEPSLAKKQWDDVGFFQSDILPLQLIGDLRTEADSVESQSIPIKTEHTVVRRDGGFAAPSDFRYSKGGPQLIGLMRSRDLLYFAREATGLPRLIPSRCAFNYYRLGSFIGLHRDAVRSTVTFTIGLTSNLGQMGFLPECRGVVNEALAEVVSTAGIFPDRGVDVDIAEGTLNCFDGYEIPHWRVPFEDDRGILATVSFFDL